MEEAKVVDALPPPPSYYKLFAPDAAEGVWFVSRYLSLVPG